MRGRIVFAAVFAAAIGQARADDGKWQQVGDAGQWKGTKQMASMGGKLWTVTEGGDLAATDGEGKKTAVGKAGDHKCQALATLGASLYLVKAGALEQCDQKGVLTKVESSHKWEDTAFLVGLDNRLWSIDKSGLAWRTDPANGKTEQLGKEADWEGTKIAIGMAGHIWTVNASGTLFNTDETGFKDMMGNPEQTAAAVALVGLNDRIWNLEKDGSISKLNFGTGDWEKLGAPGTCADAVGMVALRGMLYGIDKDGSLFKASAGAMPVAKNRWKDFAVGTKVKYRATDGIFVTFELTKWEEHGYSLQVTTQYKDFSWGEEQDYIVSEGADEPFFGAEKEDGKEKVTVPAGDFDCDFTRFVTKISKHTRWMSDAVPGGLVKTQSEAFGEKWGAELVEVTKK